MGLTSGIVFKLFPPKYGLDVEGGVRLIYQMDTSKLTQDQKANLATLRQNLIQILENRAHGPLAVVEPTVLPKGTDEFEVELPNKNLDLDQAEQVMGSSARIMFYWAKTVNTPRRSYEPWEPIAESGDNPGYSFENRITHQKVHSPIPGKPDPANDKAYQDIIDSWDLILAGDDVKSAQPVVGMNNGSGANNPNGYVPGLSFSSSGADKLSEWCRRHQNENAQLAIVLDGKVLSIAGLKDNEILSDNAQIDGTFSAGYVVNLCAMVNSGALPIDLKCVSADKVDPTIGGEALTKMETAGVVAFVAISAFLIFYYAFPGVVAFVALCLYVLFTLSLLKAFGATFSLAGIAGFILSVGMAVDANILVFERVKEEVKNKKALSSAIQLGFKRALPAIADSNACTIITSVVLYNFGTGPVKGFATTLIIGVLVSLFTAVTVTRSLLVACVGEGWVTDPKWFALDRNWFGKRFDVEHGEPLNVVRKAKKWFAISLITILVSVPFFFLGGFRLNVEFQGGYDSTYAMAPGAPSPDQMSTNLERAGFRGSNVKLITTDKNDRYADITVPPSQSLAAMKSDADREQAIAKAAGIPNAANTGFSFVGPSVQKETINNAMWGVGLSSCLIILYLTVRFGTGFGGMAPGFRFGLSAIGALIHDILVVLTTAALVGFLFKWEVSALFLTAMLTMIGFSVHDTIVIFDRIRENLRHQQVGEDFRHLVDRSITQSFARSINTSGTVIGTLLILVFFGTATPDLKFFVTAMLIGIISGTYSSIYNASPILYLWDRAIAARKGPQASITELAKAEMARQTIITTSASTGYVPQVTQQPTQPTQQPGQPGQPGQAGGRTYGQVRRRASSTNTRRDDLEL